MGAYSASPSAMPSGFRSPGYGYCSVRPPVDHEPGPGWTQTGDPLRRGRAWPAHPHAATHALPVSVDAGTRPAKTAMLILNYLNASERWRFTLVLLDIVRCIPFAISRPQSHRRLRVQ